MSTESKNKPASDLLPNEREISHEEIQQFFARNKVLIIASILLCVVSIGTFSLWQQQTVQMKRESIEKLAHAKTPEELETFLSQHSDTEAAALAIFKLAEIYYGQAQWDKATAMYQKLLDKHPQFPLTPSALIGQAAVLDHTGKTAEAIVKYLAVVSTYPKSIQAPQALYSAARLQQRTGKLKEAKQSYNDIMIQYPDSSWKNDASVQFEKLNQ